MFDAGIAADVITSLQLAGTDAESGETLAELEPRSLQANVNLRHQLAALDALDDRAARTGEALASVDDDPHYGGGIHTRPSHRLLDLDDRLKKLGIQSHGFFGQLPLGDVELGTQVADLSPTVIP
jgi:dihydroxyacetone kinase